MRRHINISVRTPNARKFRGFILSLAAVVVALPACAPGSVSVGPSIEGSPRVGILLTASVGDWAPVPLSFAYSWERCTPGGTSCSPTGSELPTYRLTPSDIGSYIRVAVAARNSFGSTTRFSVPIGPITDTSEYATASATVPYSCAGVGFAAYLGVLPTQNVDITLTAPVVAEPNQQFDVTVDISTLTLDVPPLPLDGPPLIALNPVGASGSTGGHATGVSAIFEGPIATIPRLTMSATPTGSGAGTATFTAGNISILISSTGFVCTVVGSASPLSVTTQIRVAPTAIPH